MALYLQPVRLAHSTVTFVPHFTISFVHLTSLSTPRVSVSYLNTYTYPDPRQQHSRLFFECKLLPPQKKKPRAPTIIALIGLN